MSDVHATDADRSYLDATQGDHISGRGHAYYVHPETWVQRETTRLADARRAYLAEYGERDQIEYDRYWHGDAYEAGRIARNAARNGDPATAPEIPKCPKCGAMLGEHFECPECEAQ